MHSYAKKKKKKKRVAILKMVVWYGDIRGQNGENRG